MDTGSYAVVIALLAGTVRALLLWRASIGVEVVNVVVLNALAEGRMADLPALLRGSGSAPYLEVAGAIGQAALKLHGSGSGERDMNQQLRHDAQRAVFMASRRLQRHAWLNHVSLAGIAFAGIDAAVNGTATSFKALGLLAATLLWLSNLRGARSIATRAYAGASALVDGLIAGRDQLRG
jgi:hypothetical protein